MIQITDDEYAALKRDAAPVMQLREMFSTLGAAFPADFSFEKYFTQLRGQLWRIDGVISFRVSTKDEHSIEVTQSSGLGACANAIPYSRRFLHNPASIAAAFDGHD